MNPLSEEEYYYKLDNMVLISSEHLRALFQARWKREYGLDWEPTEKQGEEFINGLGKTAYNKAEKFQKRIIAKGNLDDWDISVLSTVLLNFGNWHSYKSENVAVRQLKTLRNDMAHHPTKKLSLEDFNSKVDLFRGSLKGLGMSDEEIEQVITKAGRSSSVEALKHTKRLYNRARGHLKNNKFEQAFGCYEEAITMPSLLPIHLATAYEKRAECYIKFAQYNQEKQLSAEVDTCCAQALKDAARALEINDKSWQALFTMAQAHRLQRDFEKAVEHCLQVLEISPAEKKFQNELFTCRSLLSVQEGSKGHLDPSTLPKNMDDKLVQYSKGYGRNVTAKEFIETMGMPKGAAETIPGHEFYFRGRQYQFGWGVSQNEVEAARYYTKAAECGNAEGLHSLGICYHSGHGVVQDVSKAVELFRKAAHMPPDSPGGRTFTSSNVGVAAAQQDLGSMYRDGIVVEQDHAEEAKWYQKAAENGLGSAAFGMGMCYVNGRGVPLNEKLAEYQWIQAIKFGYPEAAHVLVMHYKQHMEPEKALKMFKTGREMGFAGLVGMSEQEFMVEFREAVKLRDELLPEILEFEKKHKLDAKGMTFMERRRRRKNILDGKPASYSGEFKSILDNDWSLRFATSEKVKKWKSAADKGSSVAVGLMNALKASSRVMQLISDNKILKGEKAVELLNALYDRLTNEYKDKLRDFEEDALNLIKKPVEDLFKSQHGKKGDVDMKARLCIVEYNLKVATGENVARKIELLKDGITMYPDNVHYYILLCVLYLKINDFDSGITIAGQGLDKFPENLQLLFYVADIRNGTISNQIELQEVIDFWKHFLNLVPKGYPISPWICYRIASLYIQTFNPRNADVPADKCFVEMYYNLGKQADEMLLSIDISCPNGSMKERVESFLRDLEPDTKPNTLFKGQGQTDNKIVQPAAPVVPQQPKEGVLQRKLYLSIPARKRLMLRHRKLINDCAHIEIQTGGRARNEGEERMAHGLSKVKPITLTEMSNKTETYQNCTIDLLIIEEPNIGDKWAQLVAEDKNGDAVLVFIRDLKVWLNCGQRISVLNPIMQVRVFENETGIQVDDKRCLFYWGGVNDMCRFCGEEDAQFKCATCKKALYCSKECQEYDEEMMKHSLICNFLKHINL